MTAKFEAVILFTFEYEAITERKFIKISNTCLFTVGKEDIFSLILSANSKLLSILIADIHKS